MCVPTCRLGQCGNQVGGAFFEQLSQLLHEPIAPKPSRASSARHLHIGASTLRYVPPIERTPFQLDVAARFFRNARRKAAAPANADEAAAVALPVARAVLVDMEPKVIQQALSAAGRSSTFSYDSKRSFYRQSGSGNNCK
jgi:tubulin delta